MDIEAALRAYEQVMFPRSRAAAEAEAAAPSNPTAQDVIDFFTQDERDG